MKEPKIVGVVDFIAGHPFCPPISPRFSWTRAATRLSGKTVMFFLFFG